MSDITERYQDLSDKDVGMGFPHKDAAILILAEVLDKWFSKLTDTSSKGEVFQTRDHSGDWQ